MLFKCMICKQNVSMFSFISHKLAHKDQSRLKPRPRCIKRTMIMCTSVYITCTKSLMNAWKIYFFKNNLKNNFYQI